MKIIIITKHYVKNYGSVLQTYATQYLLEEKGNNVQIANYVLRESRGLRYADTILRRHASAPKWKRAGMKLILAPTILKWEIVFGRFVRRYLHVAGCPQDDLRALADELPAADLYCTGSDQVWNPESNKGIRPAYFCEFAPAGSRKISFAASFGIRSLREEQKKEIKKYLEKYAFISVREKSGLELLRSMGLDGYVVLDPVMAVGADFWKRMAGKRKIRGKYILIYQLNSSRYFDAYADWASEKTGMKLVRICTRYDQFPKNGHSVLLPSVEQWISLFYYADYVITDSFHGSAFSILFHKEFVNIFPPLFSERLENLLSLFELQDRKIREKEEYRLPEKKIDYSAVDAILSGERAQTQRILDQMLG